MQQPSWLDKAVNTLSPQEQASLAILLPNTQLDVDLNILGYRTKVIELLLKQRKVCVLDGDSAEGFGSKIYKFTTPKGIQITAITNKGVNYKDDNEDRIAINPFAEFAAVCDGMGGHGDGDLAAEILAHQLLLYPEDIEKAVEEARKEFEKENLASNAGACLITAQIIFENESMYVDTRQAGDAHMIIVNKDGSLVCESIDETYAQEDVDECRITKDQATYATNRNTVKNAIHKTTGQVTHTCTRFQVFSGQKILIFSDGTSDNLATPDILKRIQGLNGPQIIQRLSAILQERMGNYKNIIMYTLDRINTGVFSDGFISQPKPDNWSIVVMEVP